MDHIKSNNNFGVLRLLFAYLVILSHSTELLDGNRSKELLRMLFGTISFGDLAVYGFFLISGFLVFKSYYNSQSLVLFFIKRILRIYPAFIVAFMISILLFATLSGGWGLVDWSINAWLSNIKDIALLSQPYVDGVFKDNPAPLLNGPLWSIQYEFICYLLTPIFVIISIKSKKIFISLLALFATTLLIFILQDINWFIRSPIFLSTSELTMLITAFITGGAYFVFRDKIIWKMSITLICVCLLAIFLSISSLAEIGLFIFGGYLLFNFALNYEHPLLNKIGTKHDISYGVYLYAWPIQSLFVQYFPSISPWQLFLISSIFASMLGYLSWVCIEKPFMRMKNNLVGTTPQIN